MVQLAQFGLQLFLGHGGGMGGWRGRWLGLTVVRRQSRGPLSDIGRVAMQLEDQQLVIEDVGC
jgi:hypothetical protein